MHVLQLGPYPPPEGGISRNMLAIRDELVAAGDTFTIIATARSSEARDEAGVYTPRSATALIGLLRTLEYDVLHLHIGGDVSPRVLALAFVCTLLGRGRKVLTLHSGEYPQTVEGKSARPWSFRGFIFRRFDRIIAVNRALAEVFARYGMTFDRLRVILPYDLRQPGNDFPVPDSLKKFCSRSEPLLIAVGGLEKAYDPLFQIAAMKDILAVFPGAGLMIVGDGSMRNEVKKAVAASGIAKHIYIAGNVDHAVTLHLIRDADVLLRTTLFDGDAISIREALFLGTPVIATDNGMRPDGVRLIAVGDSASLVREVRDLAARPDKFEAVDGGGNDNITQVIELYRQLL